MPARVMHFTFDTKVKINKKTVSQFVEEYRYYIKEDFNNIKIEFGVDEINVVFLKEFVKILKGFDCTSVEDRDVHGKERIVKNFVYDLLGNETKKGTGLLGVRYLYDEWEYEGCGYDDHYYLTYTDDVKMIKKTIKETVKLVEKLGNLGVNVEFKVEIDGKN